MPEQTERERLIKELNLLSINKEWNFNAYVSSVADFILADRRRILSEVEKPLKDYFDGIDNRNFPDSAIEKCLAKIAEMRGDK